MPLSGMGICSQIHDHKPESWVMHDDKYPFSLTQMDTIKDADKTFRFDVRDLVKEWRVVDMICEVEDLLKEMDEMKHYGTVSKAGAN